MFGFPAYHEETVEFPFPDPDRWLDGAALQLSWTVEGWLEDTCRLKTGISFWSWGEQVEVRVVDRHHLHIRSQCSLPTQCIDWGRNRTNVDRLVDMLMTWARENPPEQHVLE